MSELVEFLRARLDEDEQVARWAMQYSGLRERGIGENWEVVRIGPEKQRLHVQARHEALTPKPVAAFDDPAFHRMVADHIARHDPARVLREVEAKRRMIETCEYFLHDPEHGIDVVADATLRLLAEPYADHPDYRSEEEWNLNQA